jgi:O-antigen ligase
VSTTSTGGPRWPLIAPAALWIVTADRLTPFGLNSSATVVLFLAAVIALSYAVWYRRTAGRRPLRSADPLGVPLPLWAFAGCAAVSVAVHGYTVPGAQNALVYLSFAVLIALAAQWTTPHSALLLLHCVRAAAVLAALGYLVTVVRYGPGNGVLYPARIFGEVVWLGMVAAVPLAGRSVAGHLVPLLLIAADVLSLSRTSAAVCAVLYLGVVARGRSRWEPLGVLGLAGALGAGAFWLATRYQPLRDRFVDNDNRRLAGLEVGTTGRAELWHTVWRSARTAPWTGHGIGSAERLLGGYQPHNDYLRLWHDFGVLGLGLWLLAVLWLGLGAWRRRRAAQTGADWAIHQAALLALVGLSLNVLTSNLLVYVFVMCPVAVVIGASVARAAAAEPVSP